LWAQGNKTGNAGKFLVDQAKMDTSLTPACTAQAAKTSWTASMPVLIHGAIWQVTGTAGQGLTASLLNSEWEVYRAGKQQVIHNEPTTHSLVEQGNSFWSRKPPLYGDKVIGFIGVNCFVVPDSSGSSWQDVPSASISSIHITYNATTSADDVPFGLNIPHWSWDGLQV
jgi:hypothetical protein